MPSSHKVTEPKPRMGDGYGYLVLCASPELGRNVIRGNFSGVLLSNFLTWWPSKSFTKRTSIEKIKHGEKTLFSVDIRCGSPGVIEVQPVTYNGKAEKHR